MTSVIGIDIGGTKIAAARFSGDPLVNEEEIKIDTNASNGFDNVVTEIKKIIDTLKTDDTAGIGIGVPGLVQTGTGRILKMPNIPGSDNISLIDLLSDSTDLPITVDNDANCFALAEALEGVGKGHKIMIGITMGTGVGGGIVINEKLFHGHTGYAGEFGHMLLRPGQVPYKEAIESHIRGEVEQFLSGTAMGKRCVDASNPDEYLQGEVCEFMHPEIYKEITWLCTNLIHTLDPSVIVFGGSAGRALGPHLSKIETELKNWLLPGTPVPVLKIAELKDAAVRGAALLTQV